MFGKFSSANGVGAWVNLGLFLATSITASSGQQQPNSTGAESPMRSFSIEGRFDDQQVASLARLALAGIDREYPNKPSNVMTGPESLVSPADMHPSFYGSFDWHSSVHGHWMLIRLLKLYPENSLQDEIVRTLNQHLRPDHLSVEAAYFQQPENRSFERMYGWAWALRLVTELEDFDSAAARTWREAVRPLEEVLVKQVKEYLPKLDFPIRTGVHPDTAFALGQILDYARAVEDQPLEALVLARSRDYFFADRDYPFEYEPSGEDFFSSGLNEADLMRRVLNSHEYSQWLNRFLPSISAESKPFVRPVPVSDVSDPKIVHLAGLNLSRSWCLSGIASALDPTDPRRGELMAMAQVHADAGLAYVFSGHYEGEHWLATFAVYSLSRAGLPSQ